MLTMAKVLTLSRYCADPKPVALIELALRLDDNDEDFVGLTLNKVVVVEIK